MRQLNFRHFNTNSKKFSETVNFSRKKKKRPQKGQYYFVKYIKEFSAILRQFISDFRRLPKFPEDCRTFSKTNEEVRPLRKISEEPSKHLTVLSSETANIKYLANLTANTKNYGRITFNTKPHSDPLKILHSLVVFRS